MKMGLIQPFVNSADAVLSEMLDCMTQISNVTMDEQVYRRKGVAACVAIRGDIEGRIIFDVEPKTARRVATALGTSSGDPVQLAQETICELANMVIGNAVTLLNDQGFRFKVFPPDVHGAEQGYPGDEETETLVMCFETPHGKVHMNMALRYNRRRWADPRE